MTAPLRLLHLGLVTVILVCCGGSTDEKAASDAGAREAGSGAGVVACAGQTCPLTAGQLCCHDYSAGSQPHCMMDCGGSVGDSFACDGPEDCAGAHCCALLMNSGTHATCKPSCTWGSERQHCHSDDECADAPGGARKCCPISPSLYPGVNACDSACP